MTDSIVQQFAAHLSQIQDASERARVLARVKMLAMQEAPEEAFEAPIVDLGTYLATPIPVPPSLVWPTIAVRGEITVTLGRAGKGKTTMNLLRILRWAAGRPFFDDFKHKDGDAFMAPSQPLRTLIVENEGNAGMFQQAMVDRLDKAGDRLSDEDKKLIMENILIWGTGGYSGLKLDKESDLNLVRSGLEKWRPDIVFIEPFRGLWSGEENSSTDMAIVVDNMLGAATDYDCAIMLSHHERKSGVGDDGEGMSAGRGSTVLEGAAATMENFQPVKNGEFRELSWSKARYLTPPPTVRMQYDTESTWYRHVPLGEIKQNIMDALDDSGDEPMTLNDLHEELGETKTKLRAQLKELKDDGKIVQMSSTHSSNGSTGYRYRVKTNEETTSEGMSF